MGKEFLLLEKSLKKALIAFIMTASIAKCRGLSAACLSRSLQHLAARGVPAVHAGITHGNTASECLFTKFGFVRQT